MGRPFENTGGPYNFINMKFVWQILHSAFLISHPFLFSFLLPFSTPPHTYPASSYYYGFEVCPSSIPSSKLSYGKQSRKGSHPPALLLDFVHLFHRANYPSLPPHTDTDRDRERGKDTTSPHLDSLNTQRYIYIYIWKKEKRKKKKDTTPFIWEVPWQRYLQHCHCYDYYCYSR